MPGGSYEYFGHREGGPAEFRSDYLIELGSILSQRGYEPQMQTDGGATFVRRYSPVVYIVLYVLFFPLGLLLLLARPTETLTITYTETDAGDTSWMAAGTDKRLRGMFERLGATDDLS